MIKNPNCKNRNWKREELESAVLGELQKLQLETPALSADTTERAGETERKRGIEQQIEQLNKQRGRLIDLYARGIVSPEEIESRISDIDDTTAKLKTALLKEESRGMTPADAHRLILSFKELIDAGRPEELRAVVVQLINRVAIDNDNITIYWNFS
jgi:site-specific DNA recombinase